MTGYGEGLYGEGPYGGIAVLPNGARTHTPAAETRVHTVDHETRTRSIAAEPRVATE